jgi:L-amino acid N-acyltransferase YncA
VTAIREMRASDWPAVERIYAEGIATGDATFETEPPAWDAFDAGRLPGHRLVAVEGDEVVGWAALSPTSARACYAGVVEHSVYVSATARGRGIGRELLDALLASADDAGLWTVQTSIFPENIASLALHERAGFRVVGRRERIAQLNGAWRDTLLLERRAPRQESDPTGSDPSRLR